MARQLQLRRGTTAQHTVFTGAIGEVTIDTDKDALVVHDGVQAGGFPTARESVVTAHTGNTSNPHNVTKAQVGLGNVDNTSDANKPVSTATQTALNLKANLASPTFTGTVTAPIFSGSLSGNASSATNVAWSGVASKPTTISGYGITDAYTKAELNAGQLDNRYYTETEVNAALALKVDDTEIASVNLLRADKYLAAQNVVKMTYDINKKLIKVQYNNATDIDYEVLSYTDGKLTNVAHYVGSVLKGNTVLTYVGGLLDDAPFIAV